MKITALMSIRQEYAEKIFSGIKTIELRRRRIKLESGSFGAVYCGSPVQSIVGLIQFGDSFSAPPKYLWEILKTKLGVNSEQFKGYFKDAETAHGIYIAQSFAFVKPVPLAEIRSRVPGFNPPQSYTTKIDPKLLKMIEVTHTSIL